MSHVINQAALPQEPDVGSVVALAVTYDGGPAQYTYVIYRAQTGNWYVTGQSGEFSWRRVWHQLDGARLMSAVRLVDGELLPW